MLLNFLAFDESCQIHDCVFAIRSILFVFFVKGAVIFFNLFTNIFGNDEFVLHQLHDFDMCLVKNEEAIRIEPKFAECYGNMANALKVLSFLNMTFLM